MRPQTLPAKVLALAVALLFAACAQGSGPPRVVVALDEAFEASRPVLALYLASPSVFGKGPAGLLGPPLVVHVTMTEGAGKAMDAALKEKKRSGEPIVLVASPLIAKAIINGGTWSGDPPLLVPEWRGARSNGLWTASTDPLPAYGAAGKAAGAFIASLPKDGGLPSCGVIFSEAPSRPRSALTAFAAAYSKASMGRPLYIRELGERSSEAAVKELLGSDMRVLFFASGPDSGAAIRSAARPGLAIGADFPAPESPKSLSFRILPDDGALARALDQERRALRFDSRGAAGEGSGKRTSGSKTVPALLVPGPAARDMGAGKLDFASFLSVTPRR
ncbi:MAG: hypothetical protein ABSF43_09955 [Rectinemataceae bacterium]|jgi:hypothetical protein